MIYNIYMCLVFITNNYINVYIYTYIHIYMFIVYSNQQLS